MMISGGGARGRWPWVMAYRKEATHVPVRPQRWDSRWPDHDDMIYGASGGLALAAGFSRHDRDIIPVFCRHQC